MLKRRDYILLVVIVLPAAFYSLRLVSSSNTIESAARSQEPQSLSLNVPRRLHSATTLADGRVLIVGGQNQTGSVAQAEIVDPLAQKIVVVAESRVARFGHTATLLSDGRVLIVGGTNAKKPLNTSEIFDPRTNHFSKGPRLNLARTGHSATPLKDGRIFIAGGRSDGSAEIFDERTGSFVLSKATMNGPRSRHSAVLLQNGDVLLVGGEGPNGDPLDSGELFKTRFDHFHPISTWMYAARIQPDMRVLPDGKVQVIGGDKKGTMEMYDPAGRFFRGFGDLTSTIDSAPLSSLLQSSTRTAFVDRARNDDKEKSAQASISADEGTPNPLYRNGYTYTEIPLLQLAVIAGGADSNDQLVQSVTVAKSLPTFVTTDRVEYPPNEAPVFGGGGWPAGETVVIHRVDVKTDAHTTFRVVADQDGRFSTYDTLQNDKEVSSYILTAVGESSGYVTQTIYRRGPSLDLAKAGQSPKRVKFYIPLGGKDTGTVQTYAGPFKYKIRQLSDAKGGIHPTATITFPSINTSWSNVGVTFPAPLPPMGWSTSGHITFNGSIEVTLDIDFGLPPNPVCCACELVSDDCGSVCDGAPCEGRLGDMKVTLKFVANFDFAITNNFTLAGTVLNKTDIVVFPLVEEDIPPSPETGDPFGFKAAIGLLGGIKFSFEQPMQFETCLSMGANATAFLSAGITSGFSSSFTLTNQHASSGFEMIQLGNTCLQLSLGPGITGKVYTEDCDPLASITARPVAGFVEGCLNSNATDPNCQLFNIDINGGMKADFRIPIGCGALTVPAVSLEHEYFKENIASFNLGVFRDLGAPVITNPASFTQSTDPGACNAVVTYNASATDSCSGVKSFGCSPPSGSVFAKGTTTVTCTATDNAGRQQACTNPSFNGNTSTTTFTVTVADTEHPVLSPCPGNISKFTDPGNCTAVTTFTPPTATDNCPGPIPVVCVPASGFAFPKGTTTVTCTATDTSNNTTSCTFTVTVADNEKPSITCPQNITATTVSINSPCALVTFAPTPADNCPGVTTSCTPPSGSCFPLGTSTVTCTATDTSNNTRSCSFTVTVFNVNLQDDSNPGVIFVGNTATGSYRFCCGGSIFTGVALVTVRGSIATFQHYTTDRKLLATEDGSVMKGTASLQMFNGASCVISDRDIRNNNRVCQ